MDSDAESDSVLSDSSSEFLPTFMEESERYLREYNYLESEGESEEEPLERTFDLSLPATHSYFGLNLEELRGRTIFDEGIYIKLPILEQKSVMLFPGQTLPMKIRTHAIDMLSCLQSNRTIGVVCFGYNNVVTPIGVTAEIYECKSLGPEAGYNLKAMGRQRFKILQLIIQGYDRISANVKILPEITLGPPFLDERLASLDRFRMKSTTEDFKRQEWVENRDAVVTPWPGWVYRQYDPLRLSLQIRRHLQLFRHMDANIPEDPTNLSFWIAQNLLLDDKERNVLLRYDCAISRLQMEIKHLVTSHMLTMSIEGPLGIYCNSNGIIHDIVTLYHAQGLVLSHQIVSTEYTWFPGYGWTIATCKNCNRHIGWKFTAVQPNLKPKAFWGLSRRNIKDV
ncbi:protein cereblon isoform X2 [Megalopta genalis]|uniref:protein cereblon isoform X2 n=1 Tax=Megalopta genalis TaxID=115081 RepID=UPI0014433B48|nr:protein cereblon isoform X2 [Megalopta genalis]